MHEVSETKKVTLFKPTAHSAWWLARRRRSAVRATGIHRIPMDEPGWRLAALSQLGPLPVLASGMLTLALSIYNRSLRRRLRQSREEVELLTNERRGERAGRIRAEKKLRDSTVAPDEQATDAWPFRPIGTIRSCFSQRNGTPRQPMLVSSARCRLTLRGELSGEFLDGLEQFSHVWVLFVFHCNTDIQRVFSGGYDGVRGKIRVPRLNGAKTGVFATRSPHHPCPIGLSVAEIVSVDLKRKTVTLAGADIVDGTPVLDLKPYVPFCDRIEHASAPDWVERTIDNDPLQTMSVEFTDQGTRELAASFAAVAKSSQPLFETLEDFVRFVKETLSRDIRSVAQRIKVPERKERGAGARLHTGAWRVVLCGLDIAYEIDKDNTVTICGCSAQGLQRI